MPRYRLDIEYDGTPFVGWQIQANGASVQAALAHAIQRFCGDEAVPQGAGRTDTGVHALGQVAHVDLTRAWPCDTVRDAVNYHLKPDPVAVTACNAVADGFHARFSAVRRHYLYRLRSRRARPVLDEHRVWWVPVPLDADAMHAAAQSLVGRHDFTTFRAAQCQAASPVKTLDVLTVETVGDEIHLRAMARSFLHNQVRSLVGTLKLVGEGKWPVGRVREALAARDRRHCGALAPPWGLYLTGVDYPAQGQATAPSACTDTGDVVQPD